MEHEREEFDEFGDELDAPEPWMRDGHIPADARRMGLNSSVPDGAMLEFAGALDSSKPLHRLVALVLLVTFLVPVLLTLLNVLR
ncbi:hypothetical protein GCM10022237_35080 [Nocardioides ginsengisoli]|uniref:Uncharacterized protein n=1 Tax=Nocardioides ginsengisoli TaxID=363868 RepID=A0ABW3W6U8_9ACTN